MPQKNEPAQLMEWLFQALADRTRLRLLNLMSDREVCVCYFVEVLDLPQPTISRHLAYLRRSGLVSSRRQGKWMHYRIVLPSNLMVRGLLMNTLRGLASDKEMLSDRLRLKRACCTPEKFVRLQGAPAPTTVAELAR